MPSPSGDDDLSLARLSLRPLRPAASMPAPSSPATTHGDLPTISQTRPQEEESCSEIELDSPPRLTLLKIPEYSRSPTSPHSPTSPSAPASWGCDDPSTSIDVEPSMLPTFGSHTDRWHSSDTDDDSFFESLVNNFITAANDVCKPPEDNIDNQAGLQRQSDEYAENALKHYNNDKDNKVKYDLISAIISCGILDVDHCYGHVNFIAKGNQENSKEELFFAELQLDSDVPTCVVSLEGAKVVGGLRGSKYDGRRDSKLDVMGIYIDGQHCYACGSKVKHPKNGALYKSGHVAQSGFYHL